ncbi:hypothetical protein R1sor_015264 [Riccia sorocarpa]|uniref:Uncharacterized protein n=1 Tax=Riccia sorocarpa TaxID=122646 RepID=A0ABD3HFM0_9MARC
MSACTQFKFKLQSCISVHRRNLKIRNADDAVGPCHLKSSSWSTAPLESLQFHPSSVIKEGSNVVIATGAFFQDRLVSCPLCECACSGQAQGSLATNMGLTEILQGMLTDCGQVNDSAQIPAEVKLNNYERLRNALSLQLIRSRDVEEESQRALQQAEDKAARYHEEIGRCLAGMRIMGAVRARVDAELKKQKEASSMWERRARDLGWNGEGEEQKRAHI